MDRAPLEVYHMIFKLLDVPERNSLRPVCRFFRTAIDSITLRELVVVKPDREEHDFCHRWYGTDWFADQRHFVNRLHFEVRNGELQMTLLAECILSKLRRLKCRIDFKSSYLGQLAGQLKELKHLDLSQFIIDDTKPILLPKLQVLVINTIRSFDHDAELTFNSPLLTMLCFGRSLFC